MAQHRHPNTPHRRHRHGGGDVRCGAHKLTHIKTPNGHIFTYLHFCFHTTLINIQYYQYTHNRPHMPTQTRTSPNTHTHEARQSQSCRVSLNRWTRRSGKFISTLLSIIEEVWEKALSNVGQVSHQEKH